MPTWFKPMILTLLVLILIGVIVLDFVSTDFEAQAIELALIGAVGAGVADTAIGKRGGNA